MWHFLAFCREKLKNFENCSVKRANRKIIHTKSVGSVFGYSYKSGKKEKNSAFVKKYSKNKGNKNATIHSTLQNLYILSNE